MKKVIYRNYLGSNPRKREISVEETGDWTNVCRGTLNRSEITQKKVCKYYIEKSYSSGSVHAMQAWIDNEKSKGTRQSKYIFRSHDEKTGETKILCKVLGDFYVVYNGTVFKIVFVNKIKVQIQGENSTRER